MNQKFKNIIHNLIKIKTYFFILISLFLLSSNSFSQCNPANASSSAVFANIPTHPMPSATHIDTLGGCYTIDVNDLPGCFCFDYLIPDTASGPYTFGIISYTDTNSPDTISNPLNSISGEDITLNGVIQCAGDISNYFSYIVSSNIYDANGNLIDDNCSYSYGGGYNPGDLLTVCFELIDDGSINNSITICVGHNGPVICSASDTVNICYGGDYTFPDGTEHHDITNNETYVATIPSSSSNCDSVISTHIIVDPILSSIIDTVICEEYPGNGSGSPLLYQSAQGNTYGDGTYMESYLTADGCDSVVTINVTIVPVIADTIYTEICQGDSILFGSQTLTDSGTYTEVYTAQSGCDSTVILELTVNPSYNLTENISVCGTQNITFPDGTTEIVTSDTSHISYLSTSNSCDSIITTNISVGITNNINIDTNICFGETLFVNGNSYSSTGVYQENYTNIAGCDSIVTYNLTVYPENDTIENITICYNDSYTFPDGTVHNNITNNETYVSIITSSNNCDSTITTNIIVNPEITNTIDTILCNNTAFVSNQGNVYNTGTYTETYLANNNCDSTVTYNIIVYPENITYLNETICDGDTYNFGSQTLTSTGSYTETYTAQSGCDSIIILNLTVNPSYNITENITVCENEIVSYPDGTTETINSNTTHVSFLNTSNSCDSIITTIVNMNPNPNPQIIGYDMCEGLPANIYLNTTYQSQIWSTGDTTSFITVSNGGTYYVTVTDANSCTTIEDITIIQYPLPTPTIYGNDFCEGSSESLSTDIGYAHYLWNTSDTTQEILVSTAGTYSVTVTDDNGCSANTNKIINVNLIPNINLNTNTSICEGDTAILDAGDFISYNWSTGENTQTISVSTSGVYSVTVIDVNTCSNSDDIEIFVNQNPTPVITGNLQVCKGENSVLSLSENYNSYIWNTNENTSSINIDTEGEYSVTVTDANGCTSSVMANFTINPNPIPSIIGNDYFCHGETTNLSLNQIYNSYLWNTSENTSSIIVNNAGLYSVTVTDSLGCSGFATKNIYEDFIDISLTEDMEVCRETNVNISVSTAGGILPYSYSWNNGITTNNQIVSPNESNTYIVSVSDANSCSVVDSVNITVVEGISLNIEINKDSICPGDPVLINGIVEGGISPYTIFNQDGQIVTLNEFIYPSNSGVYFYTAEDACGSTDTDSFVVYIEELPPLNIQADKLSACPPLTVNFIETNYTNTGNTYMWTFDDIDENNLSLAQNPVHTFDISGLYDVSLTLTTPNGCSISTTISDMINVYTQPKAKFDALPDMVSIIDPVIEFTNYSEDAVSYIWDFDDGDTSNLYEPIHEYNSVNEYNVQLIAISERNCKDTVHHLMKVKEVSTLYIPTAFSPDNDGINDYFFPKGYGLELDSYYMRIYNRWGELIWETDDYFERWDGRIKRFGEIVKSDTYVWLVNYKPIGGAEIEKTGTVTVIR